ncbi:TIGR02234 family membrane protein [Corynebacterium pyruviciproducens]|uniref:TIGR02234 family membrane protein n=1 Tax=Corynebacterium pyruviciproducens TaxID=598660 RepID=A0AAF0YUF1_9CORY|nr:TIGR02234 family membrane protein [Corynebacterium pyruviciproducens]MDK6566271.1 TIGR02234 family membrane protein [Corynebacterium pyruviciproducens]MDK7214454.1 TIGR02234 family membrane protein [Corynebacterium pyruviciproducens]WOT03026.1 TIGR02234 family membrane protein [Corynebacterium pyruviciproducens]
MNTRYVCPLALGAAGVASWLTSRLTWITVTVSDDKAGQSQETLTGAAWSTQLQISSFVLIGLLLVGLIVKATGRRVVGVVAAIAGAALAYPPIMVLTQGADAERVRDILLAGAASAKATDPVRISQWAQVSEPSTSIVGPVLTVTCAVVAVVAGVLLAMRPGVDAQKTGMLESTGTRREQLESDIEVAPDSERVMWDALDEGIDLTGRDEERG